MARKRRIHAREVCHVGASGSINRTKQITLTIEGPLDKPDIVLHLETYMAADIIEVLFDGLFSVRDDLARHINRAKDSGTR